MAVPVLAWFDGYEHGSVATGAGGPWSGAAASVPVIGTATPRTGLRYLNVDTTAAAENIQYNQIDSNVYVFSRYIRFVSLPTAVVTLLHLENANGDHFLSFNNATNKFRLTLGASVVNFGPAVSAGVWYLVDARFNTSDPSGTTTAIGRVDGDAGTEASTSVTQVTVQYTDFRIGTSAAHTMHVLFDDEWLSTTAADYPMGAHSVESLIPTGDGTHNITTSGDFDSFTATAFDNSTTTGYTFLAHRPLQLANTANQVIRQELGTTANYMEFLLEDLAAGTDTPVDVWAFGCHVESATAGASLGEIQLLLADNTEVLTTGDLSVINSTEDPGTTVNLRKRMCIRPAGGWTRDLVNGLKVRVGFAHAVPDVNFIDLMVQVAMQPSAAVALPARFTRPRTGWNVP